MVCADSDYDASSGVCSHPVWVQIPDNGFLPPLPISDAAVIGVAICLCWAVAFCWRAIGKVLAI